MITGLDHIHIICGNMEEAVQYFEKVFDGRVVSRSESRGFPLIRMDVKGAPLALLGTEPKAGQLTPGKGNRGLDHFGFKVKDLEQTAQDLKKKRKRAALSHEPDFHNPVLVQQPDAPDGTACHAAFQKLRERMQIWN